MSGKRWGENPKKLQFLLGFFLGEFWETWGEGHFGGFFVEFLGSFGDLGGKIFG